MKHQVNLSGLWLLGIAISAFGTEAEAQVECAPVVGRIVSVEGSVHVQHPSAAAIPVSQSGPAGTEVCAGDIVTVGARSRAAVALVNGVIERWDENTTARIGAIAEREGSWLDLLSGAIQFFSWRPRELTITTPFLNAAVEGTEFAVRVEADRASVAVLTGRVRASNAAGSVVLAANQAAVARAGEAPQIALLVRPTDAVQWALFYPPIFPAPSAPGAPAELAPLLGRVSERLQQGDVAGALDRLAADPTEPRLALYSASLLLSVGRVEEARREIDRALALDPQNGDAHALRAVIAVAQNERPTALAAGERAVALSPGSAAARIALSYALQADFRLEEARDQLLEAVRQDPGNALAQARLAELWLALGYRGRAAEAAGQAAAAAPDLSRAQSVLGFTDLTRLNVDEARTAFDQAIALDPSAAQAHLGRGLAKIRRGNLAEGRRDIEIAASLDPSNALIRTYLGKAYYEERRSDVAQQQFTISKEFDPLDPTPWLYSAIDLQTRNRPVEALEHVQRSIALNDNRLVYRSRLLLDDDRAARGGGLARIYTDLGFEQLALAEGWRSLEANPANASVHRFLADSYAARPRHEIARASELLQAQLLQPLSINPIQPRLTATDIQALGGIGPAAAAFNEFTPLFTRNDIQFTGTALIGNNETRSDEAVLSGLQERFSYSVGQFHYHSAGFRPNNDVTHNLYDFFSQATLTDGLDVQAEYRKRKTDQGNLRNDLGLTPLSLRDRRQIDQDVGRVGLHYTPSAQSDIILSMIYGDLKENVDQRVSSGIITAFRHRGYDAQAQYLSRTDRVNMTAGLGIYGVDADEKMDLEFSVAGRAIPCPLVSCRVILDSDIKQNNAYIYLNTIPLRDLIWTFGLSYDSFSQDGFSYGDLEVNRLSPKLGIQWNVTDDVQLRFAYFRAVKRALVVDQTLEPTSIAGFNQFFDDLNGTKSERYGIGVDAKLLQPYRRADGTLTDGLYAGFEITMRDVAMPIRNVNLLTRIPITSVSFLDQTETLYHGYLYWTPHPNWALSTEYMFEHFERHSLTNSRQFPPRIDTTTVPLTVRYFNPFGIFAQINMTYVQQKVSLAAASDAGRHSEEVVLADAMVGYRLPKRRGVVSLEVRNLFDQNFRFQDVTIQSAQHPGAPTRFIPDRTILTRLTLNF